MARRLRWGIMGTGAIARKFAQGLAQSTTGALHAVGSRRKETAEAFGREFELHCCHGDYRGLVHDDEVDAIYIATPHSLHKDNAMLALEAGKPVLCEKPFTLNASEAREVVALARHRKLFLMEAMWTRFLPIMKELRRLLDQGAVGEIRMVDADFGFRADPHEEPRLFDRQFGGGSLLDVGVYPLSFFSMILGKPSRIVSMAEIGESGVDDQAAFVLGYESGALAVGRSAIRTDTPQEASILGTSGSIRIESPFWCPARMRLTREGKEEERFDLPYGGNGYGYEADEVACCIEAGKTESDAMKLTETIEILETMDTIRKQWGLRYDAD